MTENMINEEILQIAEYHGEGYKPLIDYGTWRVAYLRFIDELIPQNIKQVERHRETDEVFVLLEGQAVLFLGEGEEEISALRHENMQPGKLYNVRKNTWHTCVLSRDATILLVENNDTNTANSDYLDLQTEQRQLLVKVSGGYIGDWRGQG